MFKRSKCKCLSAIVIISIAQYVITAALLFAFVLIKTPGAPAISLFFAYPILHQMLRPEPSGISKFCNVSDDDCKPLSGDMLAEMIEDGSLRFPRGMPIGSPTGSVTSGFGIWMSYAIFKNNICYTYPSFRVSLKCYRTYKSRDYPMIICRQDSGQCMIPIRKGYSE